MLVTLRYICTVLALMLLLFAAGCGSREPEVYKPDKPLTGEDKQRAAELIQRQQERQNQRGRPRNGTAGSQ